MSQPDSAGGDLQAAAERATHRNLPQFDDMPIDPATLQDGVELHPQCLPLAPLLGVWRGRGEAEYPSLLGQFQYGQQISFSHDGRQFLAYEARAWLLNESGQVLGPAAREVGWWRVDPEETVEMVLAHAFGICEIYYGGRSSEDSWELSTDAVVRSDTARETTEATRVYAMLEDGSLAYVEERALRRLPKQHHLAAQLQRIAG
ncbi:MAG TPA: FABP family protein [Pseudonocardiaceae bacterium]|nr:FABP family protein [Pseudonocardiaceae bacterium]